MKKQYLFLPKLNYNSLFEQISVNTSFLFNTDFTASNGKIFSRACEPRYIYIVGSSVPSFLSSTLFQFPQLVMWCVSIIMLNWLHIFPDKNLPQELEKAKNMAIEKVK